MDAVASTLGRGPLYYFNIKYKGSLPGVGKTN